MPITLSLSRPQIVVAPRVVAVTMAAPAAGITVAAPVSGLRMTAPARPQLTMAATGAPGPRGLSAYQVWLEAGNTGDEATFLASLQGEPGGPGLSAYQVWLAAGNTGDEAAFFASLQGEDGDLGPGVPAGGAAGQVLAKASGDDLDTAWITISRVIDGGAPGDSYVGGFVIDGGAPGDG